MESLVSLLYESKILLKGNKVTIANVSTKDTCKENPISNDELCLERNVHAYIQHSKRKMGILAVFIVVLMSVMVCAAILGASSVNGFTIMQGIAERFTGVQTLSKIQEHIIFDVRLPRLCVAMLSGASLALAGLLMQCIFQNPLVSPYTLGVSSGAAFGACLSIVLCTSIGSEFLGLFTTPLFSFACAIATMLIVYTIANIAGRSTATLVLTGVAIGYLFSAMVSFLKYVAKLESLPKMVFWIMGSLQGLKWDVVVILLSALVICALATMCKAWDLNIMALGQSEATTLGVNYKATQAFTFIVATLLTSISVAFTGVIGFVGLVAPHIARMIIGNDYRYSIPASMLIGAILLLGADTLARIVIAPTELPVGVVTSLIGVPFYLFLVIRRRSLV